MAGFGLLCHRAESGGALGSRKMRAFHAIKLCSIRCRIKVNGFLKFTPLSRAIWHTSKMAFWLCRRVVVGPFLLLLAAVPAQKSFGLGDGNDLRKPSLDGQAKLDENQPVGFGEGHAGGEFAAEDSVFLAEKIILQSEVAAEKLVNFGDQGVGRNLGAGAHRGDSIAASAIRANSKGILPSVIAADEFLHRKGEDCGREVFSFTAGIKTPFWVNGLKTKARHQD